jgi:hypothetical protein
VSLPAKDHGPVILFLDGHGSCWSLPALKLLTENQVYPFFLHFANHTSIWAQPNNAGVNKRLYWAVEMCVQKARRTVGTPNVKYFNQALTKAICLFRETEQWELVSLGIKTTLTSYEHTGINPFNPFVLTWSRIN